jgi:hypothetical protein
VGLRHEEARQGPVQGVLSHQTGSLVQDHNKKIGAKTTNQVGIHKSA